MKISTKITSTAGSKNFFVSLISIVLLAFEMNNLSTGADPGQIFDAVTTADVGRIVSILFINFLNPILKLVSKGASWSWGFLKSMNFWVQTVTASLLGITLLGLQFPEGAAANIVNAIFSNEFQAIAVALVVNVINPLYHFFFDKRGVDPSTDTN